MKSDVAGFACASPFEARLARRMLGRRKPMHLTTPSLTAGHIPALRGRCDHITFNSLNQWRQFNDAFGPGAQRGLRINAEMSIVRSPLVDLCRPGSKLGVPLSALAERARAAPRMFAGLQGLHFHTACGNRALQGLHDTVLRIAEAVPDLLRRAHWLNRGGGYAFDKIRKTDPFDAAVRLLQQDYGMRVMIEPGTAMVRDAGRIVTQVVDVLPGDPDPIAVLDTSVNHMPEVFAYRFQPPVATARTGTPHRYALAGATCLAGDQLGIYDFDAPLKIGQGLIVEKMGAYTLGQSH